MTDMQQKHGPRSPSVAIPARQRRSAQRQNEDGLLDWSSVPGMGQHGGALALNGSASSGSSAATHVSASSSLSRQSSTSGLHAAAESPEPLGSWAGRQTIFPASAQHLPAKMPMLDKAKLDAAQRSLADTAWRFKFKRNWRREQLKRIMGGAAFAGNLGNSIHADGGWAEALEALIAAAPAVGVRLDAWAGLATGEAPLGDPSAEPGRVLGASHAALALDEELDGVGQTRSGAAHADRNRSRPWGGLGTAGLVAATVLPGAYPATTIRRVPMRGSKLHAPEPAHQTRAMDSTKLAGPAAAAGSGSVASKLQELAAKQLAILSATAQPPQQRGANWVGAHLAPQHGVGNASGVVITVQLTDTASGATRVLMRGAAKGNRAQLVAALKQQVKHVAALDRLPLPHFRLLGSG